MSQKTVTVTFRAEPALYDRMVAVRAAFGTPLSEQMRRGLELWLETVEGRGLPRATAKAAAQKKR